MIESRDRTIEKEIYIEAPLERVFGGLTNAGDLEVWFCRDAQIDLRVGGLVSFVWNLGSEAHGQLVEVDPPHRLVYTSDEGPELGETLKTWQMIPERDGTRLRLLHSGWGRGEHWDRIYDEVNRGWDRALEDLRAWAEGHPLEKRWYEASP